MLKEVKQFILKQVTFRNASIVLIVLGYLIRLIGFTQQPAIVHPDEASIGYEAYSIMNYGIDRNGNSMPVHLVSWGSGQNALYAYIAMPFIKLFGNTTFAVRLPMVLTGCISIIVLYKLLKSFKIANKYKLLVLGLFAILPWHIMKSRWCIESNLFPDLIFWASTLLYFAIQKKKNLYGVFAAIIFGLSTYAYGTSYLFVPLLLIGITIFLLVNKKTRNWKNIIALFGITTVISLPMILFVIINYFNLPEIQILNITIPRLDYNRFTEITKFGDLSACFDNLFRTIQIFWTQTDNTAMNSISDETGMFYIISLPFIFYGLYLVFTKKYRKSWLAKIIIANLIAGLAVAFVTVPNIYRVNCLWIPVFALMCLGLYEITKVKTSFFSIISLTYAIFFVVFTVTYFTSYQDMLNRTYDEIGLGDAIAANKEEITKQKKVCIGGLKAYIQYLYYAEIDPNYYLENRNEPEKNVMFQSISHIGNVEFYSPKEINDDTMYIVSYKYESRFSTSKFKIKKYGNTVVAIPKR